MTVDQIVHDRRLHTAYTMAMTMKTALPCNKFGCSVQGLKPRAPASVVGVAAPRRVAPITRAAAVAAEDVPDMAKRTTMNLLLLGAISAPVAFLGGPFLLFFVPPRYVWTATRMHRGVHHGGSSQKWPTCSSWIA